MEKFYLYRQIADSIRRQILQGDLVAGERLPSVREMTKRWNCTIGTIQRAYQELAIQGLLISRPGQGTRIVDQIPPNHQTPLRRAALIHRAEAFLLETLTAGHTPTEVEEAVRQALERWRVVSNSSIATERKSIRFSGSHDLAVAWLATHFEDIAPDFSLLLKFSGSIGGLIALAENNADVAGCHLWDVETDSYNVAYVKRILPAKRLALLTLAHRRIGMFTAPGNPFNLHELSDLTKPGVRFVNRQVGSGTRVWLDATLGKLGIDCNAILGYSDEKMTHSDVAGAVASGEADAGLGLEASARMYGLDFIMLTLERYDIVIPGENYDRPPMPQLISFLSGEIGKQAIATLGGYLVYETGKITWVS